jgi:AcrR family transcriptional regulator
MSERAPDSPASRRQMRNRAAILSAARSLIVEQGVAGVSLRQIAARADYSPAALYEYFPSKDALVAELAQGASDRLYAALAAVNAPEPLALLEQLACAYVDWARENREDFLLIFGRLGTSRTSADQPVGERSAFLVVMRAVESAIAAGAIHPGPGFGAHELTYSLWALVHGQAMLQTTHLAGFKADFAAADRAAVRCFLAGLARPPSPKPRKSQR